VSDVTIDAFFLRDGIERRFAILSSPRQQPALGAILFIHGFAEELNKSRRMTSLTAHALAQDGYAVLQVDLHGCGDSAGDFAEASWSTWIADVAATHGWLRRETRLPVSLCAMRLGALLAIAALPRLEAVPKLVFWQPVLSGAQFLRQFLRLKVANTVLAGGSGAAGSKSLLESLGRGDAIEVAGYMLPPALALPLEEARLELAPPSPGITWLEVASSAPASIGPASIERIEAWRQSGVEVEGLAVHGPQFWQTQEIEECPALIDATRLALRNVRA
jgi:exosortase A-associated hydrolase 2